MQFNTYLFILAALPLTLCGYFLIGKLGQKWANLFLTAASIILYACGGLQSLIWLLVSIAGNTLVMLAIHRWEGRTQLLLWVGICLYSSTCILPRQP